MNLQQEKAKAGGASAPALELKNITKLYSGTVALRDVSLTVKKGEVHGLIGKNGAGKSTLVGVMSGLVEPSSGEILLDGETFSALTPIMARRHHISIITQEPQVIEESTVAENLFSPSISREKRSLTGRSSPEGQAGSCGRRGWSWIRICRSGTCRSASASFSW